MSTALKTPENTIRATGDGGFEIRYGIPTIDLTQGPETRAAEDAETWDAEGWAVVYGVEDSYGTTFVRGCFTDYEPLRARYPYLWMHRSAEPVGIFIVEDREEGLWIKIRFDDSSAGRDARARARSGSAPGCSVGFRWYPTTAQQAGDEDGSLILSAVLVETSQITMGMQAVPGAELQAVRSTLALVEEGAQEDEAGDAMEPGEAAAVRTTADALTIARARLNLL